MRTTASSSTNSSGRSSTSTRVTPLAAGETPLGGPIASVRQNRMAINEEIRLYADEQETQELFRIKARSVLDTGGSRYDVFAGEQQISTLDISSGNRGFARPGVSGTPRRRRSRRRTNAASHSRSPAASSTSCRMGNGYRSPYNFDLLVDGQVIGHLNRKFQLRDRYVLDLSGDHERKLDRRLAIALAIGLPGIAVQINA